MTEIAHDELLIRIVNGDVNLAEILYKSKDGSDLTPKERSLLNTGKGKRTFYQNIDEQIVEIRICEATQSDWLNEIQVTESFSNPFNGIALGTVNCANRDSIIAICYQRDQAARADSDPNMGKIDQANQQLIIPYLQQCEWPSEKELIKGIWFVIQHSNSGLMTFYYNRFKKYENMGWLEPRIMALMEDRMLMNHGYPQIYGSQIIHKSVYKMIDPKNVNKRRAKVGLGTIEENTRRFDFEFDINDHLNE